MTNSLIIDTDANGNTMGAGGGLAILGQSLVNLQNVTIAKSTAGKFGAGIFASASEINVSGCKLIENELSPGTAELVQQSYGAAIFTNLDPSHNLSAIGAVGDSIISNNIGLPIYDDDNTNGPINAMQYLRNQIYSTTFGDETYIDSIVPGPKTTSELNALTVTRVNGTSTQKAPEPNTSLSSKPSVGTLMAVPSSFIELASTSLQASAIHTYYLGYAWSGGSATLDGSPLSNNAGVIQVSDSGNVHTLLVDGVPFTVSIKIQLLDKKVYLPLILRQ
jgi:hypothetical protein